MADQATVYYGAQLGKETTPGTGVPTTFRPGSFGLERMKGQGAATMFRPQGSKLNTITVPPGRRWVEIPFSGVLTFNEMVYILCSALQTQTPSADGTNGKKWVFGLQKSSPDTKTTYTCEIGSSIHAQKVSFAQCRDFTFDLSPVLNTLSGVFLGQAIQDDIAMTASPAEIALSIVPPQKFDVSIAATWAGLPGAAVFGRPMKVNFAVSGIVQPISRMNSTDTSYINLIEQAPTIQMQLTTDADDAGMALLANLTAGSTVFVRVKALGAVIAGAIPSQELFQLDFAGTVGQDFTPIDDNGAALAQWTLHGQYDVTSTKCMEITLTNTVASIL